MEKIKLTVILEKGDNALWGRVQAPGFLHTTVGNSVEEVTANLRELIADFLAHEGQEFPDWQSVSINDIEFNFEYDLTALFEVFQSIKIGAVADLSGINQSLMRQYATGKKRPSQRQAKKIEDAIHLLGQRLSQVAVA
jgi:predicted RNase H-like HicB family nuclease